MTIRSSLPLLPLIALIGGCAAGPDYRRPQLPASSGYAAASQPTAIAGQTLDIGRDIQADWWTLFRSPRLDALIAEALAASPDLAAAEAALKAAQENVSAQRGFFFPTIGASYAPQRSRIAGNLGGNSPGIQGNGEVISTYQGTPASEGGLPPFTRGTTYSFHTAQLTVAYTPDIFGANRRSVQSLQAQARAQALQLEAARLTLVTNIVAAAIQDGQLRQQIAITQAMITDQETAAGIAANQQRLGYISAVDRAVQDSALAEARKLLPPLRKQFEQNRNLLRLLAGHPQDADVPEFTLDEFQLPEALPLTLPSALVEQRPDVRIAEERLRAATADFGVARADLLPQVTITGDAGGAASRFGQMFWNSGTFFDFFLNLAQPLFNGGTLKHRARAARAGMEQSAAEYRATALLAFQDVANSLRAIETDADALNAAEEAASTSGTSLTLVRQQHAAGYLDRIALIGAERSDREARLDLIQARAVRLGNSAALFQALGGGWWNRASSKSPSP